MAVVAAPFAAFVMDARTGQEIYSQNADTRLHPASLTKMMTLYMAFNAIERGQVRLDSKFLVSSHAASQPPSRLGLRAGQRIELRYLIRAAAVKSANDAATTIGENIAGSEPKFAAQMTAMAKALGMRNSNFRNANGLSVDGHYSTARDMTTLGRRLFYDFPQYYSIFSRRSADAGIATVSSTNKRFLDSYEGADGIKTGYTRAAGFNLTASAKRGPKRIIATVLGGNSTAHRNAVMAQLLDTGFGRAPSKVRETRPAAPVLVAEPRQIRRTIQVARVETRQPQAQPQPQPQPQRQAMAQPMARLSSSDRPTARATQASLVTPQAITAAVERAQKAARADKVGTSARPLRKPGAPVATASTKGTESLTARPASRPEGDTVTDNGMSSSSRPIPARRIEESASLGQVRPSLFMLTALPQDEPAPTAEAAAPPPPRQGIILAAVEHGDSPQPAQQVVSRASSGARGFGVSLGIHTSRGAAEQLLLRTALQESNALGGAQSRVGSTARGYEATFLGMSRQTAELACGRLAARQQECKVISR
ncbi:MAG: D-alanyl-D-alanine carboxypeptidase family protein [Paracoccus sp. (in: a-proteobacteria)]|uniref:D-alanyl-D-alanine carboxypeptidase family protein n=1 Tax=Paracoccus sp. TaxID=267 RepID=UPI0039E33B5C